MLFILNSWGVVDKTIRLVVGQLAGEIAKSRRGSADGSETYGEALRNAIKKEESELIGREPLGKSLGFIEMIIYLYSLEASMSGLTGAILLFKAFTGWLGTPSPNSDQEASTRTLARYYSYAIGNFISLLWTIFVFEFIRLMVRANPGLAEYVKL